MFVTGERVAVSDGVNTIFIRSKMDLGTRNRLMDALAQVRAGQAGTAETTVMIGSYLTALAQGNILDWEGPAFLQADGSKAPCTPEMVARLDPDEPLVAQALEEIGRRNPLEGPTSAEKKAAMSGGGR